MKKLIATLIVLMVSSFTTLYGQSVLKDNNLLEVYKSIPKERVFIHHNATLLFTGEHLYYNVYCLDQKTEGLSSLSKMAYVELVGEDRKLVFRHKIRLESGLGQGDFQMPTSVPTGSYKLLGYTQWMKNDGQDLFFQSDINIINPYQITSTGHLEEKLQDSILPDSTIYIRPKPTTKRKTFIQSGENFLSMTTDKKNFKKREQVSLTLSNLLNSSAFGNYSISVRKLDTLGDASKLGSHNYIAVSQRNAPQGVLQLQDVVSLPELRGEIISGKVVNGANEPVANKKVAISLPGKDFVFDVANTNENGVFFFNLDEHYHGTIGIFQVLDNTDEDLKIVPDLYTSPDYGKLEFVKFTIGEDMRDMILKRSIHNQIENGYASVKSDIILDEQDDVPFYRNFQEKYSLDDYTRFNTIRETMVEIIDHVWIKNDQLGDAVFQVRPFDLYLASGNLLPMVIVDGVFIQHHKDIMDFNSKKIRNVYISRDRYLAGSQIFQGILAIETMTRDFNETFYRDYLNNIDLFKPLPVKNYFAQQYSANDKAERIPDFRYQLVWEPNLILDSEEKTIHFYTSDITGGFEISLEGFSNSGQPVSLRDTITVE